MKLELYDRVKTLVERDGFPAGTIDVIVSFYANTEGCEVEVWDDRGYPEDVVTFSVRELELVKPEDYIEYPPIDWEDY